MKLIDLKVDAFGVWSKLHLRRLSDGLNVFYGPNEAGKTTLMQFVRAVLYGFSPERRARYLPPVDGGPAAGSLLVDAPQGSFQISRRDDLAQGGDPAGTVSLIATDGGEASPEILAELLGGVDEAVFHNVFALGIREFERLGHLTDTEAAAQLYQLSAGLDRVSLVEVLEELKTSRVWLWNGGLSNSHIGDLLLKRERTLAEISDIGTLSADYAQATEHLAQAEREIYAEEQQATRLSGQVQLLSVASSVRELWQKRTRIDADLAGLGPVQRLPSGAAGRLDQLKQRLHQRRQQVRRYRALERRASEEAKQLSVNDALLRQAPRIQALGEQQPWIQALENRAAELGREIVQLETELSAERQRAGLPANAKAGALDKLNTRTLAPLWPIARAAKEASRRLQQEQKAIAESRAAAQQLSDEVGLALVDRAESDIVTAAQEAGHLVSQLRRRQQLDQRVSQMERQRGELAANAQDLLEAQVLPVWALGALGAAFIVGVVLVLAGFLLPLLIGGSINWFTAVIGLAVMGTAAGTKFQTERSHAARLDDSERQVDLLNLQLNQAREEQRQLDVQFPPREVPLADRLAAAEADLAALEQLLPAEARRKASLSEAQAAENRLNAAKADLEGARKRWKKSLKGVGLPEDLKPAAVRRLSRGQQQMHLVAKQLDARREELDHQKRSLQVLSGQITVLAAESSVSPAGSDLRAQLRQLNEELKTQSALSEKRQALSREARKASRRYRRASQSVVQLKRKCRDLLRSAGAENETQFQELAARSALAASWLEERETVGRQIRLALGQQVSEAAVSQELDALSSDELAARRKDLAGQLEASQRRLMDSSEQRGRLHEQLRQMAADRRLGDKQVELAQIDARLEEAVRRWQVLAVAHLLLLSLRNDYEQNRQPETLREASEYLARLTEGAYQRVWTRLDERVLLVDDAEGHPLPIEVLSRGAREQLFLSLRLALASWYARQGTELPLVLDDLLVNFDLDRARAAAGLLRDFAQQGHQLLIFTCHEHIAKLFRTLKVEVRDLPSRKSTVTLPTPLAKSSRKPRIAAASVEPLSEPLPVEPLPIESETPEPAPHPWQPAVVNLDEDSFDEDEPVIIVESDFNDQWDAEGEWDDAQSPAVDIAPGSYRVEELDDLEEIDDDDDPADAPEFDDEEPDEDEAPSPGWLDDDGPLADSRSRLPDGTLEEGETSSEPTQSSNVEAA